MTGTVITFYSFKGGVGRSFAVANISAILSQWGYRTLVIDFDIEAPGLNHFFCDTSIAETAGVLGFVGDVAAGQPRRWNRYATPANVSGIDPGNLWLMPASSAPNTQYIEVVQKLDWDKLYEEHDFGSAIERLRQEWVENFDFILIDSRTGITDFSGLTTAQLPDVLAFLFTPNFQSLLGSCDIARKAMDARRQLPVDRPAIMPLPIAAKFDQTEEYDRAQFWRKRFADQTRPFFECWVPPGSDMFRMVDLLSIPYVPRWSFGEELAAVSEVASSGGARSPSYPASFALETIAALIANRFDNVPLLLSSRDEYVLTARAGVHASRAGGERDLKIFLSYSHKDQEVAAQVKDALEEAGFQTFFAHKDLEFGSDWAANIEKRLLEADAMVALVSNSEARYQKIETETFLRAALRSDVRRPIIPLFLPGSEETLRSSRLSDFHGIAVDPNSNLLLQIKPLIERLNDLAGDDQQPTSRRDSLWWSRLFGQK